MFFALFSIMIRTTCLSSVFLLLGIFRHFPQTQSNQLNEYIVLTVATEDNDGLQRFIKSAEFHKIPIKVLGMGETWTGGDIKKYPGGGQKVRILREAMQQYKDNSDLVVIFVDSYDVVFLNSLDNAVSKFRDSKDRIVFSAEGFCWPDKTLKDKYPVVKDEEKRFLNSGGFMGYAPDILKLVTQDKINDNGDDQLYYTQLFLKYKDSWKMRLDTRSEIFQNLNGALDEVTVRYSSNKYGQLFNVKTNSTPIVAHGNGPIKTEFNTLTNYLNTNWNPDVGCQQCSEDVIDLNNMKTENYPTVLMSVFIEYPTPFITEFFERLGRLDYPKTRMDVSIHYATNYHKEDVADFKKKYSHLYKSVIVFNPTDYSAEFEARNAALVLAMNKDVDFLLSIDSIVQLTNEGTLSHLVSQNRSILAPLVTRVGKLWSNFWGALSEDEFYARSDDYIDITNRQKLGVWNVPHISNIYLIQKRNFLRLTESYSDTRGSESDMAFSRNCRDKTLFMYVTNMVKFGHLTVAENVQTSHLHNDLWQIFDNPHDWQARYIHQNYSAFADPDLVYTEIPQPCPDVFWFPVLSEVMCLHLIEEMEFKNEWSNGTNKDARLEGGYENVPTRDIHMRQIDWEEHWIQFLRTYIHPIQRKVFQGYDDLPWARLNFIVRYKPDEQPSLRPHHDSSSYSINIALNRPGIDYQGGGTNFLRYNCAVIDAKLGWALMHPGRVTHLHEGLRTTNGTRYIFVTFINP